MKKVLKRVTLVTVVAFALTLLCSTCLKSKLDTRVRREAVKVIVPEEVRNGDELEGVLLG